MSIILRRTLLVLLIVAALAIIAYGFLPKPVDVDVAQVQTGPLQVTIDEEGRTRIKERYDVLAPLSGQLLRVTLHEGDKVVAGKTIIATIEPSDPSLLDARSLAEAKARVKAAEAGHHQAMALRERAKAASDLVEAEFDRIERLKTTESVSEQEFEAIFHRRRVAREELRSAEFAIQIAAYEVEMAQSALVSTQEQPGVEGRFSVLAPIDGTVLKVFRESSGLIMATTPIMQLGDPNDIEVEIDILSRDAARVRPGTEVILELSGRPDRWEGRVRLVEPQAFTKVSALGVEEQRVNVIADFVDVEQVNSRMGDGFAVDARIVVWEANDVVQAPSSALFRRNHTWTVYVVERGVARLREVEIGQSNGIWSQVLGKLKVGESVILYPSDRVTDGRHVRIRATLGGEIGSDK